MERDARFAGDVSHELRSPVTTMVNALSVLQARRAELPPTAQQAVDLLVTDLTRFRSTVDDLLEISTVDQGRSELHCERLTWSTSSSSPPGRCGASCEWSTPAPDPRCWPIGAGWNG